MCGLGLEVTEGRKYAVPKPGVAHLSPSKPKFIYSGLRCQRQLGTYLITLSSVQVAPTSADSTTLYLGNRIALEWNS